MYRAVMLYLKNPKIFIQTYTQLKPYKNGDITFLEDINMQIFRLISAVSVVYIYIYMCINMY